MGILQARILEWVAMPSSRASFQPRDQTKASCVTGRFFTDGATSEAQEYWRRYSLPHLQGIFPTQELNWGLLHCRQILYQLSYQGSPVKTKKTINKKKKKTQQLSRWEKIFANEATDKALISKIWMAHAAQYQEKQISQLKSGWKT